MSINQLFELYKSRPSDINEHLDTLRSYALGCDLVVEMGVRWIVSTWAFLDARPNKLLSIDINHPNSCGGNLDLVKNLSQLEKLNFEFIQADTTKMEIPECDLLFIDTWHVYDQLKKELELHGNKSKKYIIFHDTETFGLKGETSGHKGLSFAIDEFLESNKHWKIKEVFKNNNGLTVLERIN